MQLIEYKQKCINLDIFIIDQSITELYNIIDQFIPKILIRDYNSDNIIFSARDIIKLIIKDILIFFFDQTSIESILKNMKVIDDYIILYNKLKKNKYILYQSLKTTENTNTKIIIMDMLNSIFQDIEDILIIWKDNKLTIKSFYSFDLLSIITMSKIQFIPFIGGYYNPNFQIPDRLNSYNFKNNIVKINSFYVTKYCITNGQYLEFILDSGYSNDIYWSLEGIFWKKYYCVNNPKNWHKYNNKWYINKKPLDEIKNHAIVNVCYYEAEAFANYMDARLPTENEWEWIATNRNKTIYPWGLKNPTSFDINSNFINDGPINNVLLSTSNSLYNIGHLLGNVWEWTTTVKSEKRVVKGGCWCLPSYLITIKSRKIIKSYNNNYETGFRLIKDIL